MAGIEALTALPNTKQLGNQTVFVLPIDIEVAEGSFLHVGGTPSPLTEKKQPVFSVDGQPVIPASSFKGAFRQQVEAQFIQKKDALARTLGLTGNQADLLKPSIPSPRPSKAEQDLLGRGYRTEHSEIKVEEDKVQVPKNGLCPPSYFFGATGLEGYLRIPNFFPMPGEWRIDQTRIRIDRRSQTAAPGAIVTGDQVKPGSVFKGELLIFRERQGTPFGRCRTIGGVEVDLWLKQWTEPDNPKRQLFLLNEVLIPALNNVEVLGGQKSLGGGRVVISLS
ncbi:MAG: RAMP superfamily CRISPR-associated protein [Candidatus Methylomirabilales bacterium]